MRVLNQQWQDSLLSQQYPFVGNGPAVTTDGLTLPADCFLDLNLLVDQTTEFVYLASITTAVSQPASATFALADGTVVGVLNFGDVESNGQAPVRNGTAVVGVALGLGGGKSSTVSPE